MKEGRYRVLIVEDEDLIARNIARHIEQENPAFRVVGICSNGEDAMDAIKEVPPDVVFTDISMPMMNGLELASWLHSTMSWIPCVILTGYADFEYAREALHYGVVDYLLKPIDVTELNTVLKKLALSMMSIGQADETESGLSPEEIVALVRDYVGKHYAEELDLNTISRNLGFSSSYLTKVFNRIENTTPSKYIRQYRMNIARKLLSDESNTIAMVAQAVGYNDPFHFSKSFKLVTGITPTEYREAVAGGDSRETRCT